VFDPDEEAIFDEAHELADPDRRLRYLDEACAENPCRRSRLNSLLAADFRAQRFLADDPFDLGDTAASAGFADLALSLEEKPGRIIGRYRLVEKIGEGGCGVVYAADQKEPVRRRVALKIIKPGMDSRQVIARFEAERQALAMMDHPNIAKIFDAGTTETLLGVPPSGGADRLKPELQTIPPGRPYFVMELVQGAPITGFCDKNQLSVKERINLFIQVCQGVQHAHQKGVIHRDLKPSNILVTENDPAGAGRPKIIDFGIAKATEQKLTEETFATGFSQFLGTPAYMSPEQAAMTRDIDTRSDIYSLGVLLYELLIGATPFDGRELLRAGFDEMRRIIRETEPVKPSTRVALASQASEQEKSEKSPIVNHQSSIDSDLDWIVMKCLEKDRERRYETAGELVADLQRHLGNEPVLARPPSAGYRLQRLVQRNKLAFAAAVAVSVTLLAGIAGSSWQALRATRAERNAIHQAGIAREQAIVAQQQSETARAVQEFLTEHLLGAGVDIFWATNTDFIAPEVTRALIERVAHKVEGKFTNQPGVELEIRQTLLRAFWAQSDYTNAAVQSKRLLELRRGLLGPHHSDTLETMASLAEARYFTGQRREARALLQEATAAIRNSTNALSTGAGMVLLTQGVSAGRDDEALALVKEAHKVLQQTIGRTNPTHLTLKYAKGRIAHLTELNGQWDEAETLWRELLQERERDHGSNHSTTFQTQFGLARLLVKQGKTQEAQSLLEPLVAFHQQRLGTNSGHTMDSQYWLGQVYEQQGRIEEVVRLYADICPRLAKHLPRGSAMFCCSRMAEFFVRHRRYAEARAAYDALRVALENLSVETLDDSDFEALLTATAASRGWSAAADIYRNRVDFAPDSLWFWLNKAWVFRYVGDDQSYQKVVTRVLELPPTVITEFFQHVPVEIAGLGHFQFSDAQLKQVEASIDRLKIDLPGRSQDLQAWGYRAIGQVHLRLGRLNECLDMLEESARHQKGPDSYTLFLRAICLHRLGRRDEAGVAFKHGEDALKTQLPGPLDRSDEFQDFLLRAQLYQQVLMHREAATELADSRPGR